MLRIAIVEDESEQAERLIEFIKIYKEKNDLSDEFETSLFPHTAEFIASYKNDYDIIFMDIELPDGNGMDAAQAVRRVDDSVTIIFVTKMAQYAINGYAVGALDFMVKPVNYYSFSTMFSRALSRSRTEKKTSRLIRTSDGMVRVDFSTITYIEVAGHRLIYHTPDGVVDEWGKMGELEKELEGKGFARGNNCYLINLRKVRRIEGNSVVLTDCTLQLSRGRRKEFMRRFAEFVSGGGDTADNV